MHETAVRLVYQMIVHQELSWKRGSEGSTYVHHLRVQVRHSLHAALVTLTVYA
jgi:hypothetical protein